MGNVFIAEIDAIEFDKSNLKSVEVLVVRNGAIEQSFWEDKLVCVGDLAGMEEDASGNKTGGLWTDIIYDPLRSNSFSHSNTRQPLHTDGSYEKNAPELSFFYCIEQAEIGGSTTFLSLNVLRTCLKLERPDLLKELETTKVLFSKGNDSKVSQILSGNKCVWNYFRSEQNALCCEFHNFLESRIINMGVVVPVMLRSGDAVLFKDDCVLHGRNAFIGNRWLRKVGLNGRRFD